MVIFGCSERRGLLRRMAHGGLGWYRDRSFKDRHRHRDCHTRPQQHCSELGLSASQEVSGDPLFKRIRSRHFRRLKASFAYSAIVAGTV
eukprot:764719-Hanusia_phi.AAC.4